MNLRINQNIPLNSYIEFDMNYLDGSTNSQFARWIQDNTAMTGIRLNQFNATVNTWYHVILKINQDGTVTCNMNDQTYIAPATNFDNAKKYVQFIFTTINENTEIRFKNLNIWTV